MPIGLEGQIGPSGDADGYPPTTPGLIAETSPTASLASIPGYYVRHRGPGQDGRTRTFDPLFPKQASYHCSTPWGARSYGGFYGPN